MKRTQKIAIPLLLGAHEPLCQDYYGKGRIRMAALDGVWDMIAQNRSLQQPQMPVQQQKPYEERDYKSRR